METKTETTIQGLGYEVSKDNWVAVKGLQSSCHNMSIDAYSN